jgi:spermidine/putrescine transport system substrate-binding protein
MAPGHGRQISRRALIAASGATALGAVLAPLLPARAEAVGGHLEIFAWEGFEMTEQLASWREAHGVTQDATAIGSMEDVQAKFVGGNPPPYDIAVYSNGYERLFVDRLKIVKPLDESKVPNYNQNDILPFFYKSSFNYFDGQVWAIPEAWGINTIIYNSSLHEEPKSYLDLLKPEFKGKLAIADDTLATWPAAARCAGLIDKYPDVTKEELKQIFDILNRFKENARVITLTYGDLITLFVSGEVTAVLCGWIGIPGETAKQGVTTTYSIPKEGPNLWSDAWFIPISSDNEATALAWINEYVSPEMQAAMCNATSSATVNRRAVSLLDPAIKGLYPYENLDSIFASNRLLGAPPRESDQFATYDDWVTAWQEFKAG